VRYWIASYKEAIQRGYGSVAMVVGCDYTPIIGVLKGVHIHPYERYARARRIVRSY
jgi:hypothetical protein